MAHAMTSKPNIAAIALIAAASGAIAGLLFAPKAGKELRADISNKAHEGKEMAANKMRSAKEAISSKAEDVRDKTS